MTTMADELREMAARATSMAERIDKRRGAVEDAAPLAIDVMRELVPAGARLNASQARNGTWWAYLVMPRDWWPADTRGWMHNEPRGHWWTDRSGATADEALRKALTVLLLAEGQS